MENTNEEVKEVKNETTEPAQDSAKESKEQKEFMIPKRRLDEVSAQYKEAEAKLSEVLKELEEAKGYKEQITELEKQIEDLKAGYESEKLNEKRNNLLRESLEGKVIDFEVITKLINLDKIEIKDDKVSGLEEQIKELKESKPYLFKKADPIAPKSAPKKKVAETSFARQLAQKRVAQIKTSNKAVNYFK